MLPITARPNSPRLRVGQTRWRFSMSPAFSGGLLKMVASRFAACATQLWSPLALVFIAAAYCATYRLSRVPEYCNATDHRPPQLAAPSRRPNSMALLHVPGIQRRPAKDGREPLRRLRHPALEPARARLHRRRILRDLPPLSRARILQCYRSPPAPTRRAFASAKLDGASPCPRHSAAACSRCSPSSSPPAPPSSGARSRSSSPPPHTARPTASLACQNTEMLPAPIERRRDDGFTVSTDPALLNIDVIHAFLTASYWAQNIPRERVAQSIEHSLNFGVYDSARAQVGFARVITD